ncbi:hypothetical protein [Nocardia sp. NPDC048505]|uniref:hypothetical protein n=1 Tax=unclassified Nocardia TaxID=2637762 RepID=UPI0033C66031
MRARGITYDTGFAPGGRDSRPDFDPGAARRELRMIADELHCDAVRITGDRPDRLSVAAEAAAAAGLEVWFSPFPCELSAAELLPYFADCAERAAAADAAVFVTGCEFSLFATGFLPGADTFARIASFTGDEQAAVAALPAMNTALNATLADLVAVARERFRGKLTYAAGTWEDVDWTPFDIIGIDAYGDPAHPAYRAGLHALRELGKPIAATEVGCCTYRGAAERNGIGWDIIDYDLDPPRIVGDYRRDEDEPVRYMRELFALFEEEAVDTAFWYNFAAYTLPHHPDPHLDLDLASFGVCKLLPDGTLAPKRAFAALAEICRRD